MKRSMLLIVFFLVSINVVVAQDLETSNRLYQSCAGCHGVNAEGNENLNAPALSIFSTWYLERQIRNFNQGFRENHIDNKNTFLQDINILESNIIYLKEIKRINKRNGKIKDVLQFLDNLQYIY